MWQEHDAGSICWRVSLECSQTRQRFFYASIEDLFAFLKQQTAEGWAQDQVEEETSKEPPPASP
jgi:hypothetical protein